MKTHDTTFENLALADEAFEVIRLVKMAPIGKLANHLAVKRRRLIRVLNADPRFTKADRGTWTVRTRRAR